MSYRDYKKGKIKIQFVVEDNGKEIMKFTRTYHFHPLNVTTTVNLISFDRFGSISSLVTEEVLKHIDDNTDQEKLKTEIPRAFGTVFEKYIVADDENIVNKLSNTLRKLLWDIKLSITKPTYFVPSPAVTICDYDSGSCQHIHIRRSTSSKHHARPSTMQ